MMKYLLLVSIVMALFAMPSFAGPLDYPGASIRFFIDKDGGGMEVRVSDAKNVKALDAIRGQL